MNCPHCDATIAIAKSLQREKSESADECPECGEELVKESRTRLEKNV